MLEYPPEYFLLIIRGVHGAMKGRIYSGGGCKKWRSPRYSGLSALKTCSVRFGEKHILEATSPVD